MRFGLLDYPIQAQDDFFSGINHCQNDFENESTDWERFLPIKELQNQGVETMACVSFSALNCLEILFKAKFNKEINFSDRFLAKESNTTEYGNGLAYVADAIRNKGLVTEDKWPYVNGWENYYAPLPSNLIDEAKLWTEKYSISYEWAYNDILNALKFSPLQVTVFAWNGKINDIYLDNTEKRNHAVVLIGYKENEYWKIFDSYENVIKKLEWNYKFGTALKYNLIIKQAPMIELQNNTLVNLVEGVGGFGLYLENKLYIDDLAKILAVWQMRNNGNTEGKVKAIKQGDWDKLPKFNLKNKFY